MEERKIWMRLGVEVTADTETIKKLLQGDESVLKNIVNNGKFQLAGESYIPASMVEEYNETYDENVVEDYVEDVVYEF